ncbi:hypothetical protein U9M48_009869 [Paspalum notatum var. saurae]|uniref:XH/XS domain-containing protein n=1 Tax=Paspalum notatum var. saurae TaxID=547442 RepID=A0AAQ3WFE4_PASNO
MQQLRLLVLLGSHHRFSSSPLVPLRVTLGDGAGAGGESIASTVPTKIDSHYPPHRELIAPTRRHCFFIDLPRFSPPVTKALTLTPRRFPSPSCASSSVRRFAVKIKTAACSAAQASPASSPRIFSTSPVPMEHSSSEDSDVSDSDIIEYKDKIYAQLRAGKLKVKHGEKALHCPFCLGKKKQDYNLNDLLQHATGIGAALKRSAKVRATHLGLAMFLEKDIAGTLEKPLQIVLYKPKAPKNDEEIFVWPWMGIVVNLQHELKGERFSMGSGERLGAQFSRFRPLHATILGDDKDQPSCAIIKFAKDWSGFKDALAFEKHFVVEQYGKPDWNKRNCRKDDLYGWLARSDDYYSSGPIGEHLRKNGDLRKVSDLERERQKETGKILDPYVCQIEAKIEHVKELEQKNTENDMMLARVMEEKDRLFEEHNEKIKKMQKAACQSSRKIIAENICLRQELETRKKEVARKHKQLEKLTTKGNTNREKLEAAKEENAKENRLLDAATLKQKEEDEKLLQLIKKQEQEKEDVLKMIYNLEMELASKQRLEIEREQMNGKLEVMKCMGEEGKSSEEIDKLHEALEEKDAEMEGIDSLNQTLIIKQRRTNDELEEAKKELTHGLQQRSSVRSTIGVKRMGELDQKAFLAACKEKTAEDDDEELAILCSKWEDELRNPEWHPFKVVCVDGQEKEILKDDDEKLQALKAELGETAHDVVVKALREMNEYNPSGRYPIPELWHLKEDRKAPIDEVAAYTVKQWKTNKRKHTYRA